MPNLSEECKYAIYAEAEGHDRPLLQVGLTFGRLIDDVVLPYQQNETFFVDGAPVTPAKLKRIKILLLRETFKNARLPFNRSLTWGNAEMSKLHGEQYATRFEHMLRENSEDVTSQVIKAYNQVIKPSIKDYMPKRDELISAAWKFFVEGVRALGS
ncbi:MAG: hypothetical protein ABIU05_23505 [Nitrospirales bacterium]